MRSLTNSTSKSTTSSPSSRGGGCASRPPVSRYAFARLPALLHSEILSIRAENYWWRGQNKRTLKVGQFPRNVVTSVAGLSAHDISRPLKNSFIHTGHGDSNPLRCWGFPDRIDEYGLVSFVLVAFNRPCCIGTVPAGEHDVSPMQTFTVPHVAVSTSLYLGNPMDPPDVVGVDLGDARPTQLPGRAKSK